MIKEGDLLYWIDTDSYNRSGTVQTDILYTATKVKNGFFCVAYDTGRELFVTQTTYQKHQFIKAPLTKLERLIYDIRTEM